MHPLIKAGIGLLLMLVALGALAHDYFYGYKWGLIPSLIIVIKGVLPLFVALIGLFIFWLEIDEWKIEKELMKEEEEEKKKTLKPKAKRKKKK